MAALPSTVVSPPGTASLCLLESNMLTAMVIPPRANPCQTFTDDIGTSEALMASHVFNRVVDVRLEQDAEMFLDASKVSYAVGTCMCA